MIRLPLRIPLHFQPISFWGFAFAVLWFLASDSLLARQAWAPAAPSPAHVAQQQVANPALSWIAGMDNLLVNGGFDEELSRGWSFEGTNGVVFAANSSQSPVVAGATPLAGATSLWAQLRAGPLAKVGAVYQDIAIPADASSAVVSWLEWTDDTSAGSTREVRLEVRALDNKVLAIPYSAAGVNLPFRQTQHTSADVSAFIGQTVRLAFVMKVLSGTRIQLDSIRLVTAPMPGVEFDVYLAVGHSPQENERLGRTANLCWRTADLKSSTLYNWQVVTVRDGGRIPGPVWRFITGVRSRFDHLEFAPPASPQVLGQAMPIEFRARDLLNFAPIDMPNAGTTAADLAAITDGLVAPTIVISEVVVSRTNAVEFMNVSAQDIDVSSWQIAIFDDVRPDLPRFAFKLPAGTSVTPGIVFQLRAEGRAPGQFPDFYAGQRIAWQAYSGSVRSRIGVALLDAATNLVDFANLSATDPAVITGPTRVGLDHWLGPDANATPDTIQSYQRIGNADHQSAADWTLATNSLGKANSGLQAPFALGTGKLRIVPERITNTMDGVWTNTLKFFDAGTNVFLAARDNKGHMGFSARFDMKALPLISLHLPSVLQEAGGMQAAAGAVRLHQPVTSNVVVRLMAEPANRLDLPASVIIPASATEAVFDLGPLDNAALEGPAPVTVSGAAEGFEVNSASVLVLDNETATLSLTVPGELREGETGRGRLALAPAVGRALIVSLVSSDSAGIRVPRRLTVPAGETGAGFDLLAVEDDFITGPQTIRITARVEGWPPTLATATALDNEPLQLDLDLPTRLAEGAGTNNAGTVRLRGLADADFTVNLFSDDESEVTVPATVTIKAGQGSAKFYFAVVDDSERDGTQTVGVRAGAPGFIEGAAIIRIADNDPHRFTVEVSTDPKFAGGNFPVTITAMDVNGELIPAYTNAANLSAWRDQNSLALTPNVTDAFAGAAWAGRVTINAAGPGTRIVAEFEGARGQSDPFRVLPSPVQSQLAMHVADLVWDSARQRLLASVAETDTNYANHVVIINPETGAIDGKIPLGRVTRVNPRDNPGEGRLALSDDGQFLYAVSQSSTMIQQFNLTTRAQVREFAVGKGSQGEALPALDLEVVPGKPDQVAVARIDGWNTGSVVIYDRGQPLPDSGPYSSHLMLAPDGATSFSYMGLALGDMLFQFKIGPSGLTGTEILPHPPHWFGGDVRLDRGLLYFSSGMVYNPATRAWAGQYLTGGMVNHYDYIGRFDFSNDGQRIWFMSWDGGAGQVVDMFHRASFKLLRRADLTMIPGTVYRLWQCGDNRLAMHNSDTVYLLQTPLLTAAGEFADLAVARTESAPLAITGEPFTYTLTVTNLGPATATDVILDDRLPGAVGFVTATVSQGRWLTLGGIVRAAIGDLLPGARATLTVTVKARHGDWFANDIAVAANEWDPVADNSRAQPVTRTRLGLAPDSFAFLPLSTHALSVGPAGRSLYASVGDTGSRWANRIVMIEADTGEVIGALDVGPGPGRTAVSDDGRFLYAAVESGRAVRRVNLATGQSDLRFELGRLSENVYLSVIKLLAAPGRPDSVAVLRLAVMEGTGTWGGGVAIYDNGVARPNAGMNMDYVVSNFLEFSPDGSMLYGANILNSALEYFSVTDQGTTMTKRDLGLIGPNGTLGFAAANGLLYTSDGRIVDPGAGNLVAIVPGQGGDQRVLVHPAAGRICYTRRADMNTTLIQVFDQATREHMGNVTVSGANDFTDEFLPLAGDRLAFRLYGGAVFIVRSSLLAPAGPDTDGDGLPDAYELANGLDPKLPDAEADPDSDGLSNMREYIAGTHPKQAASAPRLRVARAGNGALELRMDSVAKRRYQLERQTNLGERPWEAVGDSVTGDGTELVFRAGAPVEQARFYRVRIWH